MKNIEIIKMLFSSFNNKDDKSFMLAAEEFIKREKRLKHNVAAKDLEQILYDSNHVNSNKRFKSTLPVPRDNDKGFPLLEIHQYEEDFNKLILSLNSKEQLEQIIKEYKDSDILASYNLKHKNKILFCGKPGTGKTYSARLLSSVFQLPLIYIRFDAIISSYLGETAGNLRKVFDFIENGEWIILFDEVDIIGKNRDDSHEHGEIKRVVNNFLQMLDSYNGKNILIAATNHQNILDSAIWRRFDEVVYFNLPTKALRKKLIIQYLKPIKKEKDINIEMIADKTNHLSPSDIKMIVEDAMKIVILEDRELITENDLLMSVKKFQLREKVRNNKVK